MTRVTFSVSQKKKRRKQQNSIHTKLIDQVTFSNGLSNSPNTSLSSEDCCVSLAAFGLSLAASSTLVSAFCKTNHSFRSGPLTKPEKLLEFLNYARVTFLNEYRSINMKGFAIFIISCICVFAKH